MSLDLHESETLERMSRFRAVTRPEPGIWDNFASGTGSYAMRGAAETARAASMAIGGAISGVETLGQHHPLQPVLNTTLSDAWFRTHDDVFQRAVDYWTPKPGEVGEAAQVAGAFFSTLPLVIASPGLAVAKTQLSAAEDLLRKGVSPGKAEAVGAVQGLGLGLGVWMPILGQNLWQRVIVGGAGFNVLQGAVTRGVSGSILEGTKAENDFKAFDWTTVTLDALLGLAFGGLSHLSPAQRKQGEAAWTRIHEWISTAKPSEIDALAALRQAEHLNVETAPGKLATIGDIETHVNRVRQAIDQLAQDKPVEVTDLPAPKVEPDAERQAEAGRNLEAMREEAQAVAEERGIVMPDDTPPKAPQPDPAAEPAQSAEADAGAARTDEGEKAPDPLAVEAARFAEEHPDVPITLGRDADGNPVTKSVKDFLAEADADVAAAHEDAKLFQVAAACMLGVV